MARARPGHFTFGSGGSGTTEHLAGELLKLRAGLDLVHVPYRGGAAAMTDIAAGRISMMFTNLAQSLPLIEGGQLKALGIADRTRHPALPEVKTFAEMGVQDLNVTVWWGLMGPPGLPDDVMQRLNAVLNEALASTSMREALMRLRAKPIGGSVDSFAQRVAADDRAWGQVIRGANITVN
jgi:tripartite-type tricarboxylate transporter receptor subunit TctC